MAEENRKYKSFHDIPPRDYMYFPKGTIEMGKPGKFSRVEIAHLTISIIVLTIAFSIALSGNNLIIGFLVGFRLDRLPLSFFMSLLGVLSAFFFHELAHKFMAQKYGLWAEFRMYTHGLFYAIILGFTSPIVFAAPGAVMFMGEAREFEMGYTALSGPLANIITSVVTLPLYLFVFYEDAILSQLFGFVCFINAILAAFNLLPFEPFDGVKIVKWNALVWTVMFIIAVLYLSIIMVRFNPAFQMF